MIKIVNIIGIITKIMEVISALIINVILLNIYCRLENGKILFLPFLICSVSMLIKSILLVIHKKQYARMMDKVFTGGFLLYWFGLLFVANYSAIKDGSFTSLLFSVPFWLIGIYMLKKTLFKPKEEKKQPEIEMQSSQTIKKSKQNSTMIISVFCIIIGIFVFSLGIYQKNQITKNTKNYIKTNAYYEYYEIYSSGNDGTTYRLIYRYKVDGNMYMIETDGGTNYIPEKNSVREIKYNPNNPGEAIFVDGNSYTFAVFIGAFFIFLPLTVFVENMKKKGCFKRFKIDILEVYIGFLFLGMTIGVLVLQNATTTSLAETIKSLGLWSIIPLLFVVAGLYLIIRNIFCCFKNIKN